MGKETLLHRVMNRNLSLNHESWINGSHAHEETEFEKELSDHDHVMAEWLEANKTIGVLVAYVES